MNVVERFKILFFMCGVCGHYLPGIDSCIPGGSTIPYLLIWTIALAVNISANCADWTIVTASSEQPFTIRVFCAFCVLAHSWGLLKLGYFFVHRKYWKQIFSFWDNQLTSKYELKRGWRSFMSYNYRLLVVSGCIIVFLPFTLVGVVNISSNTLFLVSNFNTNLTTLTSSKWLATHQFIASATFAFGYVIYFFTLALILELSVLEFVHLRKELKKLCNEFSTFTNYIDGEDKRNSTFVKQTEKLGEWVNYHVKLLQFIEMIRAFYAPLVFGDFSFMVTAFCGLIYCDMSGYTTPETTVTCKVVVVALFLMMYLVIRIADTLENESSHIHEEFFYHDWRHFPIKISKMFVLILLKLQKNVRLHFHKHFQLTSGTFLAMCTFQYKAIAFMQNMMK